MAASEHYGLGRWELNRYVNDFFLVRPLFQVERREDATSFAGRFV